MSVWVLNVRRYEVSVLSEKVRGVDVRCEKV